jgi:hypothetical protein
MKDWSKTRTAVEVSLLALILAFVVAIALGVFVDLFWSADTKPTDAFRGAFLGAFFAFLFVRFGDALTRIYDRRAKARHALIQLEHRFQDLLNRVHDNRFVCRKLTEFQAALNSDGAAPIWMSTFCTLPLVGDLLVPLNNIDLINELMQRNVDIRKMNDTVETWQHTLNHLTDAFTGKRIDEKTYRFNANEACVDAQMLSEYLSAIQTDLEIAYAGIRILAKKDTVLGKLIQWTTHDTYPKDFENQRSDERRLMVGEVNPTSAVGALRTKSTEKKT